MCMYSMKDLPLFEVTVLRYIVVVCILLGITNVFLPFHRHPSYHYIDTAQQDLHQIYKGFRNDKWIIISLDKDNPELKLWKLVISGWSLVITGPAHVWIPNCRPPDCVYLSPVNLGQLTHLQVDPDLLQTSHQFGLSAFVFAIHHGAKYILTVSPNVESLENLDHFNFQNRTSGIVYNEKHVFDAEMFSKNLTQRTLLTKNSSIEKFPFLFKLKSEILPGLQVPLYGCRHGNKDASHKQSSLPPLSVGLESFAILHSDIVLYRYETFWALFLNLVNSRKRKESSLFLIQKLLHHLNYHVTFLTDNFCVDSNQHEKNKTQVKYSEIRTFLSKYSCRLKNKFDCLFPIAYVMVKHGFADFDVILTLQVWIEALKQVGYNIYSLTKLPKSKDVTHDVPMYMASNIYSNVQCNLSRNVIDLTNYACPKLNMTWGQPVINDQLLIVTFDKVKDIQNILFLELMYRRYFKYIIYCGPKLSPFLKFLKTFPQISTFIFIKILSKKQHFMYECMKATMQMNFKVKGYIQINYNTLLNSWNLYRIPNDQLILPHTLAWFDRKQTWYQYTQLQTKSSSSNSDVFGSLEAVNRFFNQLNMQSTDVNSIAYEFLETYQSNVLNTELAFYQNTNLFYVPDCYRKQFIYLTKLASKNRLPQEIAIPTILMGLAKLEKIFWIHDGTLLGRIAKAKYWMFFEIDTTFIYPFYLHSLKENLNGKQFFCDIYMTTNMLRQNLGNSQKEIKSVDIDWSTKHFQPNLTVV